MACVFAICRPPPPSLDDDSDAAFPVGAAANADSVADKARRFNDALEGLRSSMGSSMVASAAADAADEAVPLGSAVALAATTATVMTGFTATALLLYKNYAAMDRLERYSGLLMDRLTAVLLLLRQSSVREVIDDDAGTRKVFVQVLQLMDAVRVAIGEYNTGARGWAKASRFFGVSGALTSLKEVDDDLSKAFQMLEQFVSLRTAAMLRERIAPEDKTPALEGRIAAAVEAERAVQMAAATHTAEALATLERGFAMMCEDVRQSMAEAFAQQGEAFRSALDDVVSAIDAGAQALNTKLDGLTAHQLLAAQQAEHEAAANADMHRGTHERLSELSARVDQLAGRIPAAPEEEDAGGERTSTGSAASAQPNDGGDGTQEGASGTPSDASMGSYERLAMSHSGHLRSSSNTYTRAAAPSASWAQYGNVHENAPNLHFDSRVPLVQQFDEIVNHRRTHGGESLNVISSFLGYSGTKGGRDLASVRSGRALKIALPEAVHFLNTGGVGGSAAAPSAGSTSANYMSAGVMSTSTQDGAATIFEQRRRRALRMLQASREDRREAGRSLSPDGSEHELSRRVVAFDEPPQSSRGGAADDAAAAAEVIAVPHEAGPPEGLPERDPLDASERSPTPPPS